MSNGGRAGGFPVEDFVQALSTQLDRAQDALALKAQTGRPLTFALKDLSVDLKVFWDTQRDGRLTLRHAQPNEDGASSVRLGFTTITREMVEENTVSLSLDDDPRGLDALGGGELLDVDHRRRLELAGVRTVGDFRRVTTATDPRRVEAYLGIPVGRLRAALEASSRPAVSSSHVVPRPGRRSLLRVQGANLMEDEPPQVRLSGEPVEVVEATRHELLVRPLTHHREGQIEVSVAGRRAVGFYELPDEEGDVGPDDPYAQTEAAQ